MKVYLCGPILGCTDEECKNWRELAKKEFGAFKIESLDPMVRDYRGKELAYYKEIVEFDKVDILNSDVLLVNFPKPSVGTCMEILFAWEQHKPVVVVTPKDLVISPWLNYHSSSMFYRFPDAMEYIIRDLYGKS